MSLKWDSCVSLLGQDCEDFVTDYLDQKNRRCLIIGGSGFDPRTTVVARRFGKFVNASVCGVFFREERIMDQNRLRTLADANQTVIAEMFEARFPNISIFAEGITPVGGRQAVSELNNVKYEGLTDIILDISALSTGLIFPITRMLLERCEQSIHLGHKINLHLLTIESPGVDHKIRGIPCESVTFMHGFRGDGSLESNASKSVLWLPTLAPGAQATLKKIYNTLSSRPTIPIDVCPIIPFPGHDPRMPDKLIVEFQDEFVRWHTDYRNLLYAAESDPLDAYRAICAIHASRQKIFEPLVGSFLVLSPIGNKLLAVGAMLAAIENNLPVYMVESVGYDEDAADLSIPNVADNKINAMWLCGEAYDGYRKAESSPKSATQVES